MLMGFMMCSMVTNSYYRGSQGVMLTYDMTARNSFEDVRRWVSEIDRYAPKEACRILVATKSDRLSNNQLGNALRTLSQEYPAARLLPYSAKTGAGRDELWAQIRQVAETFTAAGPASGTTTRRRAKSFLRNYYGIQQTDAALQDGAREKSSSHPGGAALTKADPYDLGKKK